ncbi:MAG: DUF4105 domain-containing protein, partial [SAR324 cluster bacterium]|nr:DUF4105 domain-containing protein [SAR324 cluster bacterium]
MGKLSYIKIIGLLLLIGQPMLLSGQPSIAPTNSHLTELLATAQKRALHTTRYWQVLLHYRSAWFGWESEVDDPAFFLAEDGKINPEMELQATLTAFFDPLSTDPDLEHPQCRFKARFDWLNEHLGFRPDQMPKAICKKYHDWRQRLNPGSVTLIFPNYYIDAPASMFGHTLLRINAGKPARPSLLNFAVNYAALVDSEKTGLIEYGFKGVFGGFKGVFTVAPYYLSVLSYNDIEQRDIWEYDLNFSQEEVDRLVRHLWELKKVYFDYYF